MYVFLQQFEYCCVVVYNPLHNILSPTVCGTCVHVDEQTHLFLSFWCSDNLYVLMQEGFVTGSFDLQDVLFYGGCGFSIMRCMSFALENCEKKDGNYSFLDLIKYNFYLPFFFFGPVMTFDRFHQQVSPVFWESHNFLTFFSRKKAL